MGLMLPRRYCKRNRQPDASREQRLPVDEVSGFGPAGTFIVTMQGETWFESRQQNVIRSQREPEEQA